MHRPAVPYRHVLLATALALASPLGAQRTGQVTRPAGPPATRPAPLPAPVNVRVEQTPEGQVRVSWDAVPGAKQYFIGRAVGKNGFQRIPGSPVSVPSYLDRAPQPGLRHLYLISAVDSAGIAGARARSDSIVPTTVVVQPPAAPWNVLARLEGSDAITLNWVSSAGTGAVVRYEVRRSRNGGAPVRLTPPGTTRVTEHGLEAGHYTYEVATVDREGRMSLWARSNVVTVAGRVASDSATTGGSTGSGASGTARLGAPGNLQVQQDATGKIVFSWDAVPGAKQYRVKRTIGLVESRGPGSAGGGDPRNSWTTTTTTTRAVDDLVRAGERYVYEVAAVDSADRAGARATSTEFRPADPAQFNRPPAPSAAEARATADDAVQVRWRLERGTGGGTGGGTSGSPGKPSIPVRFEIAHVENDGPPRVVGTQEREPADIPGLRAGRHQFLVTTIVEGRRSDPARTNVVVLPRATAGDTSATSGTAGAPPDAQVVVTKGEPVVLRVGATYSLATLGQTGWTSLATGVATVSSAAVVTARAAGDTQLVRVAPDAGNVVRVTVVSVRVTP